MDPRDRLRPASRWPTLPAASGLLAAVLLAGCATGAPVATPPISPGSSAAPREVNLIARDYSFVPNVLDLVPGETVLLHVVNGGLVVHEAVIGDMRVQDAWERAEAATVGAPPGPTPVVSVPAEVAGLRIVVASGERVDVTWTVPADAAGATADGTTATGTAASDSSGSAASDATAAASTGTPVWLVGCHIPGHWAKGMVIPVRWVGAAAAGGGQSPAR